MQDSLLGFWRSISAYQLGKPVRAWMRVMIVNRVHSVWREAAKQTERLGALERRPLRRATTLSTRFWGRDRRASGAGVADSGRALFAGVPVDRARHPG